MIKKTSKTKQRPWEEESNENVEGGIVKQLSLVWEDIWGIKGYKK